MTNKHCLRCSPLLVNVNNAKVGWVIGAAKNNYFTAGKIKLLPKKSIQCQKNPYSAKKKQKNLLPKKVTLVPKKMTLVPNKINLPKKKKLVPTKMKLVPKKLKIVPKKL